MQQVCAVRRRGLERRGALTTSDHQRRDHARRLGVEMLAAVLQSTDHYREAQHEQQVGENGPDEGRLHHLKAARLNSRLKTQTNSRQGRRGQPAARRWRPVSKCVLISSVAFPMTVASSDSATAVATKVRTAPPPAHENCSGDASRRQAQ